MPEVCPRFSRYWIWREMESAPKLKFVHKCMIGRLEPNNLGSVYMRKLAPARVSYRDDFLISFHVYMMTGSFHITLCEGTLHVNKIHVWFKIGYITHTLPVPVYGQTDFTPKRVVVSRLHDTVARFRTGVRFSPRYNNRDELTPTWHFVVVSCKQM